MSRYRVEVIGEAREVYLVEAESEAEARENWPDGFRCVAEASDMEVRTATLEETI